MNGLQCLVRKAKIYPVLGIVLLALLVRVVFCFAVFPYIAGPLNLGTDPDRYGQLAQNWVDGKGYVLSEGQHPTTGRGPGYPLLLAAVYIVFRNLVPAAVLTQCLIGALLCLVMYHIGRQLFGAWVGYTAALLGALHPLLIWYSPRLRCEPLLALLLALGIFWSLRVRDQDSRRLRDAFLAGFFFGWAALVHQIAVLLPILLFAVLALLQAQKSSLARRFVVTLLTMAAIITPWTLRNYRVSGWVIPVHSGGVTQFVTGSYEFEHYGEAPLQSTELAALGYAYGAQLLGGDDVLEFDDLGVGVDQALLPYALSYLRNEPEKLLVKTVVQIPRFWYLSETPVKSWVLAAIQGAFLLPALVGAFHTLRTRHRGIVLLVPVVYFNLVYAATSVEGRYSAPVVPYVIILAVVGLRTTFDAIQKWRSQCVTKAVGS